MPTQPITDKQALIRTLETVPNNAVITQVFIQYIDSRGYCNNKRYAKRNTIIMPHA